MTRAAGPELGRIVVLNGAPRSGKSSIAAAIQESRDESFPEPWMSLGVDSHMRETPPRLRPGIGLRPGGERPDLEPFVPVLFAALYESVAAHARLGLNVVVDVGHHDAHSEPLGILPDCARRLAGLAVLFVGLRCPIATIMERRNTGQAGREGVYVTGTADDPIPEPVRAWQRAVHDPGIYDLELDTSLLSPGECAALIARRLARPERPTAIERLARMEAASTVGRG